MKLTKDQLNEELYQTVERVCGFTNGWREKNQKMLAKIFAKIEAKGSSTLTRKEKICLSEFFEVYYYDGKVMAYTFVIESLRGFVHLPRKRKNYRKYLMNVRIKNGPQLEFEKYKGGHRTK